MTPNKARTFPMNIPILRIPFSDEDRRSIHDALDQVMASGFLTMGKFTREFEGRFSEFTGARYALACNSGTSALEIIIRSLGIRGRSIIVPTNTFLATGFAVINSGNRIVFADSRPETLCIDVDDVARRIDGRTAAVIAVHIGGVIDPDIYRLKQLCDSKGIYLLEDCAHAHGCAIDGKAAGTIGAAGAFSFFPTKTLVMGEGGAVVTHDEALYKEAAKFRNHGKDPALGNRMSVVGNNWRMSEITAVFGVQQMRRAAEIVAERQRIARFYDQALSSLEGIAPLKLAHNTTSSYYKYIAYLHESLDRAAVKKRLKEEHQVSLTGEVYADLCHTEPVWQRVDYAGQPGPAPPVAPGEFPGAEYLARHHVCLPLYPGLTQEELEWVVESLKKVLA
jgi:dTDP-4-amino-4,6-dideoxygalactose transaminase